MKSSNMISMTDSAASRVKDIVENSQNNAKGIRISLKKGGCAGLEYMVDLVTQPLEEDDLIEKNGAKIWIDPSALLYMLGMEIDFKVSTLYSGFSFHNPNQISACGCGQSVELKRADLEHNFHNNSDK